MAMPKKRVTFSYCFHNCPLGEAEAAGCTDFLNFNIT